MKPVPHDFSAWVKCEHCGGPVLVLPEDAKLDVSLLAQGQKIITYRPTTFLDEAQRSVKEALWMGMLFGVGFALVAFGVLSALGVLR